MDSSLIERPVQKLNKVQRRQLIPALQIAGLTQEEIAERLNVSRGTIASDIADMQPIASQTVEQLKSLVTEIKNILPIEKRAKKYAELATKAKNEAVSLGALQRIDDLDGIVTEKERIRAKRDEQPANVSMFILGPGTQIDFGSTTTGRDEASLHNAPSTEKELSPQDVDLNDSGSR